MYPRGLKSRIAWRIFPINCKYQYDCEWLLLGQRSRFCRASKKYWKPQLRRRPADARALRNGIPAPVADGPDRFGIAIERDHRDAVDALEFEEGRMQPYGQVPGLL